MNQENRYIYRLTYTKGDEVKYISHLDFIRCYSRAFKRAKLPVKYSQGFNPHILQNIALPCPVGVSSECEMIDIEMKTPVECALIISSLNSVMPRGIVVKSAVLKDKEPDFSDISHAQYSIDFCADDEFCEKEFDALGEFMIEKKSKRGTKEVNIKDFIKEMHTQKTGDFSYHIDATLCAGGQKNLKPELLIAAMENFYHTKLKNIKTVRKSIVF